VASHVHYRALPIPAIAVRLRPGTITLVLSNPGGGSSAFLKLISGRELPTEGNVRYNGTHIDALGDVNVDIRRIAGYIGQADVHEPLFTVRETFEVRGCENSYLRTWKLFKS